LHVRIGDQGCEYVANYLSSNTTLTELHLRDSAITGKGVLCLGESLLNHNTTLRSLNLSGNEFGRDENVVGIGECFGANSRLTQLSFVVCGLKGETCDFWVGLLKNTRLHHLTLSYNNLNDNGAKTIVEYAQRNKNLTDLTLGSCRIGSEGGRYLGEGFTHNTSLLSLYLSANKIGDEGGKAMGKIIKTNGFLRYLSLYGCNIGEDGIESIFESLGRNTSLAILNLEYNLSPSSREKRGKWIDDVSKNRYMTQLDFTCTFDVFGSDFKEKMRNIVARNKRLWKERIYWSCLMNVICRVLMFGGECLPPEMIHHVLWFIPTDGSISEGEKKRVMNHAFDKSTIEGKKQTFLECVFGKGIEYILEQLK